MPSVHILTDDLLFGSRLQAELVAAGFEVTLGISPGLGAEAIVADLTHDASVRIAQVTGTGLPVLAFYSHVESDVRAQAESAGIDRVVPRSRMAREGTALVSAMLATAR